MKIEITTGCTAFSFNVDGKPIHELTEGELLNVFFRVSTKVLTRDFGELERDRLEHIISSMVHEFPDTYECDDTPCYQCGDYVEYYKMDV